MSGRFGLLYFNGLPCFYSIIDQGHHAIPRRDKDGTG